MIKINKTNIIGYFYILNNFINKTDKKEEDDIVNLYTDLLNNINKYNNGLINIIISGSVLLLSKQQLKVDDDISNKLFEVYETSKDLAEDISTLFSYLYSDDDNNINLEKIFKFIIENKTNEIIVNKCYKLLRNKGLIKDLFKNKEYQKDAINIINESKNIPIEFIDVVDLIEKKLPELEDLIKNSINIL